MKPRLPAKHIENTQLPPYGYGASSLQTAPTVAHRPEHKESRRASSQKHTLHKASATYTHKTPRHTTSLTTSTYMIVSLGASNFRGSQQSAQILQRLIMQSMAQQRNTEIGIDCFATAFLIAAIQVGSSVSQRDAGSPGEAGVPVFVSEHGEVGVGG